jgi:glycerol kinase
MDTKAYRRRPVQVPRPTKGPVGLSIALDLGSTSIKAARLDQEGRLCDLASEASPPLAGEGVVREADPHAYLRGAESVLTRVGRGDTSLPIGIASQRSSFVLWDRSSGEPVTPLVSWQDRRADAWCRAHAGIEDRIRERSGLLLSPHYVGPKLAAMLEADATLRRRIDSGQLVLGTLETWLVWQWTTGETHRTDPTMAARTLLYDLEAGGWSDDLFATFGLPPGIAAAVAPTMGLTVELPRLGPLAATIADQASGLVAAAGDETDVALVNFGTGCFVLRATGEHATRRPGYLTGPVLAIQGRSPQYALEGTINGGGSVADRFGAGPTELPGRDPAPDAFCLPDSAGVGAPHWRPAGGFRLSAAADDLPGPEKRRVVLEGLLFRVREILQDLFEETPPRSVLLVGGLARDPFVAQGLAACLGREVRVLDQPEGTLLGAAKLAAGILTADHRGRRVEPGRGGWLAAKYERWREWLPSALGS